jgi:hypothetical protein
MEFFESNLKVLRGRFPRLAHKAESIDVSRVSVGRAEDGGIFYAVQDDAGKWAPVTNHLSPGADAQRGIDKMQHRLGSGMAPAVVAGLYPGYVLDAVYRHFKGRAERHEPFRHIYVIIDSTPCLAGWLKCADRTEVLNNPDVLFFWHEDVSKIVEMCESDDQRSHLFIPVSELDDTRVEPVIAPLAALYIRREKECIKWSAEINDYYDSIDDSTLVEIIAGKAGRKPRLLMPTHSSSTVVQYSTRDTCAAFERLGWETKILRMERDLSKWRMTKEIREFRPDVLLFINHLRTEDEDVELYPRNLMFATWIQDTMPSIHTSHAAERWKKIVTETETRTGKPRRRDILVGYTDSAMLFGYPKDRAFEMGMIVSTSVFRKRDISEAERKKYECDICFASHRGKAVETVIREDLAPLMSVYGISAECLFEIYEMLSAEYKNGVAFTSYDELRTALIRAGCFADAYHTLGADDQTVTIQRLFWQLNDVIYRNTVLDWCAGLGVNLHIYGRDWDKNPRFAKHAKGEVKHGSELAAAYQCARFGLHLNSMEGTHQRPLEIIASGGVPIWRCRNKDYILSPDLASALRKTALRLYGDGEVSYTCGEREREELTHFIFFNLCFEEAGRSGEKELFQAAKAGLLHRLSSSPDWLMPDIKRQVFSSKEELAAILGDRSINIPYSYLVSKVNDSSIAERIIGCFLKILGREGAGDGTVDFESGVSDALGHQVRDILSFTVAMAQSKTEILAEKTLSPVVSPGLRLMAAEKLFFAERTEDAGRIARTIPPDTMSTPEMLRKLFFLLARAGGREQAWETSQKLGSSEDKIWISEVFLAAGDTEKAKTSIRSLGGGIPYDRWLMSRAFRLSIDLGLDDLRADLVKNVADSAVALDFSGVCLEKGDTAGAGQFLTKHGPPPGNPTDSGLTARNLLWSGLVAGSLKLFEDNERIFGDRLWHESYFWKAHALIASANLPGAEEAAMKDTRINGGRLQSGLLLSVIHWLKGDLRKAGTTLDALSTDKADKASLLHVRMQTARLLRSGGDLEGALRVYRENMDSKFWDTSFVCFEAALTLDAMGKPSGAHELAVRGRGFKGPFNVNDVLAPMLEFKIKKDSALPRETAAAADRTRAAMLYPWSPMMEWLRLAGAASLDTAGEKEKAAGLVKLMAAGSAYLSGGPKKELAALLEGGEDWRSEKSASKIAEALFPNLPENGFDRLWIKNTCVRKE